MKNQRKSRLIEYLNALDLNEWKPLREYIQYKNKNNKDALLLFKHLYIHKERLNHEETSIEYVNASLFPNKNRKSVLNIYSSLTEEVKQFLITEQLSTDKYMQQVLLLQTLTVKACMI